MSGARAGRNRPQPRSIQPARQVAFDVLRAVTSSDAYANLLLPSLIDDAGLSAQDAALATEITYGTLRRRGTYDAVIASAAGRPVTEIDPDVRDALRLGAHQLLSTRVAPHAAVNESVNLVAATAGGGVPPGSPTPCCGASGGTRSTPGSGGSRQRRGRMMNGSLCAARTRCG